MVAVELIAVDGDTTTDVPQQLRWLPELPMVCRSCHSAPGTEPWNNCHLQRPSFLIIVTENR